MKARSNGCGLFLLHHRPTTAEKNPSCIFECFFAPLGVAILLHAYHFTAVPCQPEFIRRGDAVNSIK